MKDPNVKCLSCGVDFYKLPSEIRRYPNHFCSKNCMHTYRTKKIETECAYCKKEFYKKPSDMKCTKHFCSNDCMRLFTSRKVQVICQNCKLEFNKKPSSIRYTNNFCSNKCRGAYHNKKVEVQCFNCSKIFMKDFRFIKKNPRHCCSIDCSRMLAKTKKNWGSTRSKLEKYVEKRLIEELDLNILYNKNSIGYELDIHIPELNLAIELNGITHYKPIYGEKALHRRQEIDRLKAAECIKQNISLIVINVSNDKSNKSTLEKRYNNIKALILNRIKLYKYFSNQPIAIEI